MMSAIRFGFVPNGSRIYYLNRSQPPLLSLMVQAIFDSTVVNRMTFRIVVLLIFYFWFAEHTNLNLGICLLE